MWISLPGQQEIGGGEEVISADGEERNHTPFQQPFHREEDLGLPVEDEIRQLM